MADAKVFYFLSLVGLLSSVYGQSRGSCTTPDANKEVNCVAITNCPSLLQIINKRPISRQNFLYLRMSQCGFEGRRPLVCCPELGQQVAPDEVSTVPTLIAPRRNSLLPSPGECGVHPVDSIYGGNETLIDEYPWMVLLEYSKPNNRKGFHCGGVLINKRYVLTASHCVNGKDLPSSWSLTGVRLGEWDTQTVVDCVTYIDEEICNDSPVDIPIEVKIPHESYDPQGNSQHNDIALLRLAREVEYTSYIRPACLPVDSAFQNNEFVKQILTVAGWGNTEHGTISTIKLKVNVNGMSNAACQKIYGTRNLQIKESQICAGGEFGYDSCRGDSGGPLMYNNLRGSPPHWLLIGLVSYGRTPCGQLGWPGVHTKVGQFIPWIEANIKP